MRRSRQSKCPEDCPSPGTRRHFTTLCLLVFLFVSANSLFRYGRQRGAEENVRPAWQIKVSVGAGQFTYSLFTQRPYHRSSLDHLVSEFGVPGGLDAVVEQLPSHVYPTQLLSGHSSGEEEFNPSTAQQSSLSPLSRSMGPIVVARQCSVLSIPYWFACRSPRLPKSTLIWPRISSMRPSCLFGLSWMKKHKQRHGLCTFFLIPLL